MVSAYLGDPLLKLSSMAHPSNTRAGRTKNHGSQSLEFIKANDSASLGSYTLHARDPAVKRR